VWLGDTTVKSGLIEFWLQDMALWKQPNYSRELESYNNRPDILNALVCICPFSESREYILEYVSFLHKCNLYGFLDDETMRHLNRQQKGEILNTVISTQKENLPGASYGLNVLKYNCDLNVISKNWLWQQLIDGGNSQDNRFDYDDLNLREKPYDYHISDQLLQECLNNKNDNLRAMGQHIWRKLGKPLDEQTLGRWAEDSNFVIRANVALLRPDKIPANDPNPFVRLIQRLAEQNEIGERK